MSSEQHILACVDGSTVTQSVCSYAAWYADRLNLAVALLNVVDVPVSSRRDLSGTIGIDSRQILLEELTQLDEQRAKVVNSYSNALIEDAKSHISSQFDVEIKAYRRRGKLLPAIEHFDSENRAIVLGRRGEDHQNDRVNIGSQIETVTRASNKPILICSESFKTPASYLIAFDGSKTAIKAAQMVANSELLKGLQGYIVMVGNDNDTAKSSLAAVTEQLSSSGFTVTAHHLPYDDVVEGLVEFQANNAIDMIVIGAYGHSKFQQLFIGSTTTKIITKTLSPILLLR